MISDFQPQRSCNKDVVKLSKIKYPKFLQGLNIKHEKKIKLELFIGVKREI